MQLVNTIDDDGSFVGVNGNSLAAPGTSKTYLLRATAEGTFLLNSEGAPWGGLNQPNDGAQVTAGLFGAVNVEPAKSVWFRSQLTHEEMIGAVDKTKGNQGFSPTGQPFLDFNSPVLQIMINNEIVASDLTAVISGPPPTYLFPASGDPNTSPVPYEPERRRPFREFTIEYHELNDAQQAFPIFDYANASLTSTLQASGDAFAINSRSVMRPFGARARLLPRERAPGAAVPTRRSRPARGRTTPQPRSRPCCSPGSRTASPA